VILDFCNNAFANNLTKNDKTYMFLWLNTEKCKKSSVKMNFLKLF